MISTLTTAARNASFRPANEPSAFAWVSASSRPKTQGPRNQHRASPLARPALRRSAVGASVSSLAAKRRGGETTRSLAEGVRLATDRGLSDTNVAKLLRPGGAGIRSGDSRSLPGRAEAMQARPMDLEPGFGAIGSGMQPARKLPEQRGMIHVHDMRRLVRGEIIEHERRRQDQAPGEIESRRSTSTSPSGSPYRAARCGAA